MPTPPPTIPPTKPPLCANTCFALFLPPPPAPPSPLPSAVLPSCKRSAHPTHPPHSSPHTPSPPPPPCLYTQTSLFSPPLSPHDTAFSPPPPPPSLLLLCGGVADGWRLPQRPSRTPSFFFECPKTRGRRVRHIFFSLPGINKRNTQTNETKDGSAPPDG